MEAHNDNNNDNMYRSSPLAKVSADDIKMRVLSSHTSVDDMADRTIVIEGIETQDTIRVAYMKRNAMLWNQETHPQLVHVMLPHTSHMVQISIGTTVVHINTLEETILLDLEAVSES
jgi:hypothetical protein